MEGINDLIETIISTVLIKGRLIYCTDCLRIVFKRYDLHSTETALILDVLDSFKSTHPIDTWADMAEEILPLNLLDTRFTISDFTQYDSTVILGMKAFYENIPKEICDLIDATLSVGLDNLYGNTGTNSPLTLVRTLDVINICNHLNIVIPNVGNYSHYSFDVNNGWG